MSIKGAAYIVGAYEHPLRAIPHLSTAQVLADCAMGALEDAGFTKDDVDAFFCDSDAPGFGTMSMTDYLGLNLKHMDCNDTGGSSYMIHVGQAAEAIAAGKCRVALITLAGRPIGSLSGLGGGQSQAKPQVAAELPEGGVSDDPEAGYEGIWGQTAPNVYAMCAMRHMHQYGTTSEQLAWIKVAASHHAQWNERAVLRKVVTVDDVVNSPMIADPLHRLDCCVMTDGGGALIVTSPEIARSLERPLVKVIGHGEAFKGPLGGRNLDLTYSAAVKSGPPAFAEAGVTPSDIKYVSLYDSFTITVLMQLEDLGFCEKGLGGKFVSDGNLVSGIGKLPFNTDGGGLCNNHPGNRGGMTKVIEAVRQLRGEAHPKVQVPNCDLALAHGTGGLLGNRHIAGTLILERE